MAIFSQTGTVLEGKKRAATLGFPTANISSPGITHSGAYAGTVSLLGETYPAALYADPKREILEAHLFNFNRDIYGEEVAMELLEKVSESKKFENLEDLKKHIAESIRLAQNYFEK